MIIVKRCEERSCFLQSLQRFDLRLKPTQLPMSKPNSKNKIKLFAGSRIYQLRQREHLTQADLAQILEISPSYMNQIERDHRTIPHHLLQKLCEYFTLSPAWFNNTHETYTLQAVREAMADPVFKNLPPLAFVKMADAVRNNPELCEAFLTLYKAYTLEREISDKRLNPSPPIEPYDIVGNWVQQHDNYFHTLDKAAEHFYEKLNLDESTLTLALMTHIQKQHNLTIVFDPTLEEHGLVWRVDHQKRRILLPLNRPSESLLFHLAQIIGQMDYNRLITTILRSEGPKENNAKTLARIYLNNYFAGALLLPYKRFLKVAERTRYDIDCIRRHFGVSFEQVCHRLSTMQRPRFEGIPFYFLKVDIAGNILKSFSANRFSKARFGGACPLWNVFRAFATPGQIQVQISQTTDHTTYLNIARTVNRERLTYASKPRQVAIVLGCSIADGHKTVYASGLNLKDHHLVVPIGPGCRACERDRCSHRSFPASGRILDMRNDIHGVIPYQSILSKIDTNFS